MGDGGGKSGVHNSTRMKIFLVEINLRVNVNLENKMIPGICLKLPCG